MSSITTGNLTVPAIMNELENLGHREAPQPAGLTVDLREYQRATLGFMIDQERLPGGLMRHVWAPIKFAEEVPIDELVKTGPIGSGGGFRAGRGGGGGGRGGGGRGGAAAAATAAAAAKAKAKADASRTVWYSPLLKQYRNAAPPVTYGGILADEMGLGKTVVTLGLALANPAPALNAPTLFGIGAAVDGAGASAAAAVDLSGGVDPASLWGVRRATDAKTGAVRSRATLVVCNVSLVGQWYDEAVSKLVDGGAKSVYRYYGSGRVRDPSKLKDYDIVVTTFAVLASDYSQRFKKKPKGDKSPPEAVPGYCAPLQQVRTSVLGELLDELKLILTCNVEKCIFFKYSWLVSLSSLVPLDLPSHTPLNPRSTGGASCSTRATRSRIRPTSSRRPARCSRARADGV